MERKTAFTLVELMVLVFVVALLVGMLLPALSRPRESGPHHPKCKNRLRSLGTAMIQYIDQYGKGRYYSWPGPQEARFNGAQWIASMYWTGILTDPDIFNCPSSVDDNDCGGRLGHRFTTLHPSDISYAGRNGMLGAIVDKMPSSTIMMCDDTEGPANHDDGVNLLYFDAHVEWAPNVSPLAAGEPGKSRIGFDSPVDMLRN